MLYIVKGIVRKVKDWADDGEEQVVTHPVQADDKNEAVDILKNHYNNAAGKGFVDPKSIIVFETLSR